MKVGPCLEGVLRDAGYHATLDESFGPDRVGPSNFNLIIATNTSLSCREIQNVVPAIKTHHPGVPLMLLSGYTNEDWVADLKLKGLDAFLKLPFEETVLLKEVAGLLLGQEYLSTT